MDARLARTAFAVAALFSLGAGYRTQNFIVNAPSSQLSQEVGMMAEKYRKELAVEWLGKELPNWPEPCPITVQLAAGAGGATSFAFQNRQPFGWRMSIQGSRQRILDSVLPHEITHTIFATHFGRPLPRWADEGACTTVEHESEIAKQEQMLIQFLRTNRGIAFNKMFRMMQYPSDVLPLYSQGHSVARFLIQQGGKQKYVRFVGAGMDSNNWDGAIRSYYGFHDLSDLQVTWLGWIRKGRPAVQPRVKVAANENNQNNASPSAAPTAALASHVQENPRRLAPVPPTGQVASADAADGSWYSRQQGRESSSEPDTTPIASSPDAAAQVASSDDGFRAPRGRYAPGSTRSVGLLDTSVSRPQPVQQPRQTVLEWERTSPSAQAADLPNGSTITR